MRNKLLAAALGAAFAVPACAPVDGTMDSSMDRTRGTAVAPSGATVPTVPFQPGMMGSELAQQRVRVQSISSNSATQGAVNILHFMPDGMVSSQLADSPGEAVEGRWWFANNQLCFSWPTRGQECWAYPAALQRGQTTTLTSDRGQSVRVTML